MDYSQAVGQIGGLGTTIWGLVDSSNIFGSKPNVSTFQPQSYFGPQGSQQQSLTGNAAAFPEISQLGNLYQSYMTNNLNNLFGGGNSFTDLLKSGAQSSQALLSSAIPLEQGQLPQSVQDSIRRQSAQDAMSGGYATGGGMAENDWLRNLGIGELQGMQMGANLAGEATNSAQKWDTLASADVMNPASQMISPQQTQQSDLLNQILKQQMQQNRFNVAAAPNPQSAGDFNALQSYFGSLAGSGGGGGGSGGGGGDMMSLLGSFI